MKKFSIIDVSRTAIGLGTLIKFKSRNYSYLISNAIIPGGVYVTKNDKPVFDKICSGTDYIPIPQQAKDGLQWGVLEKIDALDNH
jgi:hypothetical protein